MFKFTRWLLPVVFIPFVVVSSKHDPMMSIQSRVDNFALIENQLLRSSRYTQMDETDPAVLSRFDQQYQLRYQASELADLGFVNMLENEHLRLYFEKDSFSLILEDLASGYMFSSRPEFQGFSQTREANTPARNLMNSGLWIESTRTTNISNSGVRVESLYSIADVKYAADVNWNLATTDLTLPYQLEANSYRRNLVSVVIRNQTSSAFDVQVSLTAYGFQFTVGIYLHDTGFGVRFEPDSVVESNDQQRLLGLQFFPYFGSAREDVFPGYMVIPDGVGALVRTNQAYDQSFQSDYFGSDLGYLRRSVSTLSLPIYGMIHRVGQFGFYHEIVEGAEHATLLANFWGRNTRYHRITNRFNLRRIYRNIINRAGDGRDVLLPTMVTENYVGQYHVLTGNQASYVGLANAYQQQLKTREALRSLEPEKTPMHVAFIMHEQEPTFFGTSRVTMTSAAAIHTIKDDLVARGITSSVFVLKGWSSDGLSYRQPYRMNLPDELGMRNLINEVRLEGHPIYLEQDYVVSSELSRRISFNQDVARNYSKLKMSFPLNRLDNQPIDEYYVYPRAAQSKLNADLARIESLNVSGLAMPSIGNTLYSYYDDLPVSRTEMLNVVTQIAEALPETAMHRPSSYMFPYLNHYFDMPITNTQLDLFSDLVPLLPIVLKGLIPTYTPYLNFNALGKERLLQMIDFAVNPSFILTEQPSSRLRFTYSNRYFTTAYSDFQEDMEAVYAYVSDALDSTMGATIVARTILAPGVSEVQYSNGVTLFINYRSTPFTTGSITIAAMDYKVVMA